MKTDRVFLTALIISLGVHAAIFVHSSGLKIFNLPKKEKKIELSYVKALKETLKPKPEKNMLQKPRDEFLKIPPRITVEKRLPPQSSSEKKELAAKMPDFQKPVLAKPDIIAVKKKITLPPVDMNKINNPSYISYYQIIREKIRRAAYQYYSRTEEGEAFLSFMVSSDGALNEVRYIEERSTKNPFLKEIALKSVNEAAPFPVFPKELAFPQLSFNVIISFEIE